MVNSTFSLNFCPFLMFIICLVKPFIHAHCVQNEKKKLPLGSVHLYLLGRYHSPPTFQSNYSKSAVTSGKHMLKCRVRWINGIFKGCWQTNRLISWQFLREMKTLENASFVFQIPIVSAYLDNRKQRFSSLCPLEIAYIHFTVSRTFPLNRYTGAIQRFVENPCGRVAF